MEGSCVCQLWGWGGEGAPQHGEREALILLTLANLQFWCLVLFSTFQYFSVFFHVFSVLDGGPSTRSKRGLDSLDFGKSAFFGKLSNICMFLPKITLPIATEYLMQNQQPSSILNLGNSNCNFRLSWYFLWNFHQLSHRGGFISRSWNYRDATEDLRKENEKHVTASTLSQLVQYGVRLSERMTFKWCLRCTWQWPQGPDKQSWAKSWLDFRCFQLWVEGPFAKSSGEITVPGPFCFPQSLNPIPPINAIVLPTKIEW